MQSGPHLLSHRTVSPSLHSVKDPRSNLFIRCCRTSRLIIGKLVFRPLFLLFCNGGWLQ